MCLLSGSATPDTARSNSFQLRAARRQRDSPKP
jgi:hypothetical protein